MLNRPRRLRQRSRAQRYVLAVVAVAALLAAGCGVSGTDLSDSASDAEVAAGRIQFERSCAQCHGMDAQGTTQGPSFLNDTYVSSHHADGAFLLAVRNGVRQHHWRFGDMPRIEGLSDEEVVGIIAYVRALQREAGVE